MQKKLKFELTPLQIIIIIAGLILFFILNGCKKPEESDPEPKPAIETGRIFVANEHAGSLSVIDAVTRKVVKTININNSGAVDLMAHNVQVAPNGKTVWVTGVPMDHNSHLVNEQLIVIDAASYEIIYRKVMNTHLHMAHVVLDPKSEFAYVTATEAGLVLQVNAQTYQTTKVYTLGANHEPHGLRYANGKLYDANLKAKTISVIDVVSGQVTDVPVGGMAVQTAVSPNGKYVFASLFDTREVVRYDVQTGTLTRIPLPTGAQGPIQLYPTPDGAKLFVCDQGVLLNRPVSDKVFVLDTEAASVTNTISVGKAAHGIVVSRDGKTAYATNTNDGTVSVIDLAAEKVITTVPVGFTPNGISYWFETGGMP